MIQTFALREVPLLDGIANLDVWMRGWTTIAPTTYQGSESLAFQRWFKFKEAFSPALVKAVIERMPNQPRNLLDCCAGSGTSGVVGQFLGIDSTLIEVNPFLADVIEAKLCSYCEIDLTLEAGRVLDRASGTETSIDAIRERLPPTFVEPGVNGRWIFDRHVAKAIEQLRLSIAKCRKPLVRRLFNVALGSILIGISNVRVDGKGRRYRGNWQARRITISEIREAFVNALSRIIQDVYRFEGTKNSSFKVIHDDARVALDRVSGPIDLVIFSPPYPNSFDYTDIYNVELWMLGYLSSFSENAILRKKTMRSHVQIAWELPQKPVGSGTLERTLLALNKKRNSMWNRRLPAMVHAYFEDMKTLISKIRPILDKNGRIAIVVGDSAYEGIRVDSAKIIAEIAGTLNLTIQSSDSVRVMRSSVQQTRGDKILDEWLIILRPI